VYAALLLELLVVETFVLCHRAPPSRTIAAREVPARAHRPRRDDLGDGDPLEWERKRAAGEA